MLSFSFTLLALGFLRSSTLAAPTSASCKCIAGQSCWPSASEWASLSQNLSYPVFNVLPPGYYCHDPHYDAQICAAAIAGASDPNWRISQPGASEADQWESTSTSFCFINTNKTEPCGQGRVPAVGVNATTVSDVQIAVKFAVERNLKLHVKNTGHDFLGRGLGLGSFMIWTHNFRFLNFSSNYVLSTGQSTGFPAITVGPGVQWADAYEFAAQNNVVIAGGIAAEGSVGAGGGWPLGGGHNILSPSLGLGADNVLELTVVLPNATIVVANQYTNPDLFWALRGGGGPSFGIAVSVTYKTHPVVPLYASFFEATTNGTEAFIELVDSFLTALPSLDDAGWSGYYPWRTANYFALMYLLPNGTTEQGNSTLGVWIKQASAIPGVTIKTDATTTYAGFNDWLVANIADPVNVIGYNYTQQGQLGVGLNVASWFLPRDILSDNTATRALATAFAAIPAGGGQHVSGGAMAKLPADYNSINPAWRTSLGNVGLYGGFPDGTSPAQRDQILQAASDLMAPIRHLAPPDISGQYLNEPDLLVPDYTAANWGDHYPRLLAIKKEIDIQNVFLVTQGVGAENWDSEQICPLK